MDTTKLAHHGIKGQKHGRRRWQNPDGSLTPAGRERYLKGGRKPRANKPEVKDEAANNQRLKRQHDKGLNEAQRHLKKQVKKFVKDHAAVMSGALWLASAVIAGPGANVANLMAAAVNMASMMKTSELD